MTLIKKINVFNYKRFSKEFLIHLKTLGSWMINFVFDIQRKIIPIYMRILIRYFFLQFCLK